MSEYEQITLPTFLEQVADAAMLVDRDGCIVLVNAAFERLTGYSRSEAIGQTRAILDSGVHTPELFHQMDEALLSGKPFRTILTNRKKDGELYQEGTIISPIHNALGEIRYFFSISRAILQTRTNFDSYTLLADSSPVGVYLLRDGKFCFINDQFVAQTGFEPTELIGKSWRTIVLPEDRETVRRHASDMVKGKHSKPYEYRVQHKDGSVRWVLESVRSITMTGFNRSGPLRGSAPSQFVSGTFVDITDRKQSEASFREALALYTATAESTTDGIVIIRRDWTVLGHNRRFEEMWGVKIEAGESADSLSATILRLMQDPESFRLRWTEIVQHPLMEATDTVELKDGRIFDVYSKALLTNGLPTGRVWSWRDVTERHQLESQLTHQAFHDSLTGLSNRPRFMDRLEHALSQSVRRHSSIGLIFLDVDNFKSVNDTFGHPLGDELLREVAIRIKACVRVGDTMARFGGDEFALLLEDISTVDQAIEVSNRIIEALLQPIKLGGYEVSVGVSGGIALASKGEPKSDELLRRADVALYIAKDKKKGTFEVFEQSMHSSFVERLALTNDLVGALKRGEFSLQYQPIMALATLQLVGVEALLRWNHPERGTIAPLVFIGIAEENGTIIEIGAWVLREACKQARVWQDQHGLTPGLRMAVNVSTKQLQQPDFVAVVKSALAESGLQPGSLTLELTESIMMQDVTKNIEKLGQLKELGVQLSIDDFGTGYASLSYLQQLPVTELKVDKSFIDNLLAEGERGLTRAIVDMGRALNLHVVAEGIEREDQLSHLQGLDCEFGQGYLFSKPVDAGEISSLLQASNAKDHTLAA